MRLGVSVLGMICSLAITGCGGYLDDELEAGEGGDEAAAHMGVDVAITSPPSVSIDDEFGTEVRVFVELTHRGGPDAETFEFVSASLGLDLEPHADITLAIPTDHAPFAGLADGETDLLELRGSIPDNHTDWGLCSDPQGEAVDGARVTLDLEIHISPGANDELDAFVFESLAVELHCTHTG
jgi:hypothetical protein